MPNRLLLRAAQSKRLEAMTTRSRLTRSTVLRYVAGYTLQDALRVTAELQGLGIDVSLDFLGEAVTEPAQSQAAIQEYRQAMQQLHDVSPGATISIKLSQLGILVDPEQCARDLESLLESAHHHGIGVEIDMEHSSAGRPTLEIFRQLLPRFPHVRQAFQAYLRSTLADLMSFDDVQPRIRLVKGAFDEPADVAMQNPAEVTQQFQYLARWALEHLPDPAFGTHDEGCIHHVIDTATALGIETDGYEFQFLHGIRRDKQRELAAQGYRVRVYLPYGTQWYPYLMRRMAERPANLLLVLRSLVGR